MPHSLATITLCNTWLHNDTFCTTEFFCTQKKPLICNFLVPGNGILGKLIKNCRCKSTTIITVDILVICDVWADPSTSFVVTVACSDNVIMWGLIPCISGTGTGYHSVKGDKLIWFTNHIPTRLTCSLLPWLHMQLIYMCMQKVLDRKSFKLSLIVMLQCHRAEHWEYLLAAS